MNRFGRRRLSGVAIFFLDLFKGPLKNQSTSVLASTRPDLDQRVGRANDSLFVLNYEQRVAFVTQPVEYCN
jgi:hypothetical protein